MMKRFLLFCFTFLTIHAFAQPGNDDCGGIINLGEGPTCDSTIYSNLNATATQIFNPPSTDNVPSCWDNVNNDVWFQFTVPADGSIVDFTLTLGGDDTNGNTLTQPQVAIYRGDCSDNNLAELLCTKAEVGESILDLDLMGLTPGIPYFIRVDAFSATATPNWGDFIVCVDTLTQVNTIDEGGSTSCTGQLFDSGGPDEDYGANENFVYSICPSFPNNECVTFNFEYYNIESFGDAINIYDGPDASSPLITSLNGFNSNGPNDAGVCYVVQASSGCLTIEFLSDGSNSFDGFAGNWTCSSQACEQLSVLQVDETVTSDEIANIVASPEAVVTIDTIICPDGAYGTFNGDGTDLGLGQGLLLTTGGVNRAVGPNTTGGDFQFDYGFPGDDDLDIISDNYGDGSASFDACIVEIDVFAAGDELSFEYIFASEEYPEFVNSINDIFSFLISGPGITGDPLLDNQLNIATVPNTNTLIEINSVNNFINWEYYRNNIPGQSIQYDGMTSDFLGVKKSLTARADVIPCNTYHLKLAIADRTDGIFDSGVFISEIRGGRPQSALNSALNIDYLVEGCSGTEEEVTFFLDDVQDDPTSFTINISGTAELGTDYSLGLNSGDVITIPAGETSISFPILPLIDNESEQDETIIITLTNNFGCGEITYYTLEIPLEDEPVVDVNAGATSAFVCAGEGVTLLAEGASTYFWTPVGLFPNSDPSSPTPFAEPDVNTWVNVIGQVGPCTNEDSIFLEIIDPQISINALTTTDVCVGTEISLEAINNVSNQGLVWDPGTTLPDPNAQVITDTPPATTTYSATVNLEGCSATATFVVNVDEFDFPNLATMDTTLCQSFSFEAADPLPGTTTTFEWTPNENMDDNTLPNPTIVATGGTNTYTLVATSEDGYCSESATVTVIGIPASAQINNPDTVEICLDESVDLSTVTSTGGVGFRWFSEPSDPTLDPLTAENVTVTPLISTTYYTELIVGVCTVYDSTFIRVDSMPDLSIMATPVKDPYCIGDTVILISPTYLPASYPDIMQVWNSEPSIDSELENLNLVLITDDTTTYVRTTTNRGCSEVNTITLNVIDPMLELTWTDTTLCAGEQVEIMELLGEDNHRWTPTAEVASGAETNNPILAPSQTTVYNVSATIEDCPAMTSAIVTIGPNPQVNISSSIPTNNIQIGMTVEFTADVFVGGPGVEFLWTLNGEPVGTENPISLQILEIGQNQVQVTVINQFGCEGVSNIFNIEGTIPDYQAPNVFTPDGDGVNDIFSLAYLGQVAESIDPTQITRFSIWNRWGNLVYDNEDPTIGWDGTDDGKPAPSDVYVFIIEYVLPNGETRTEKGDVTLIR